MTSKEVIEILMSDEKLAKIEYYGGCYRKESWGEYIDRHKNLFGEDNQ